mgnify:FL=1
MKSYGNGKPQQCIENLLRITRGEVPYDRLRGLDPHLIDKPAVLASPQLVSDAKWLLSTYEPRADTKSIDVVALAAQIGKFRIDVDTHIKQ